MMVGMISPLAFPLPPYGRLRVEHLLLHNIHYIIPHKGSFYYRVRFNLPTHSLPHILTDRTHIQSPQRSLFSHQERKGKFTNPYTCSAASVSLFFSQTMRNKLKREQEKDFSRSNGWHEKEVYRVRIASQVSRVGGHVDRLMHGIIKAG